MCNTYILISSYAQNTLQRLANLHPEGERHGPKVPDCSSVFYYNYYIAVTHELHKLQS